MLCVEGMSPSVKPHSVSCQTEGFCLNGGTCYHFESLGRNYCV